MTKPIVVVTTRYPKEVEDRIERDYDARRNLDQFPFSQEKLLSAAEGADALFITPADRLDSGFFQKVSSTVKIIVTYSVGFEHIDLEAAAPARTRLVTTQMRRSACRDRSSGARRGESGGGDCARGPAARISDWP